MTHDHDEHRQKERLSDWGLYALYELLSLKLDKLETKLIHTMATVTESLNAFKAKQDAYNTKLSTAIDGITGDIQSLNDKITQLQNTQGQITPEDQAILDSIQTAGEALADKAEALDAMTPPSVPTGTGTTSGPGA